MQIMRKLLRCQRSAGAGKSVRRPSGFPTKRFISHSYQNAAELQRLEVQLMGKTTPVIFPPISLSQLERVSDHLISTIASCDGLIRMSYGLL